MKKTCNICYGSGEIRSFKGESRFHLSVEECPECCGLGFIISASEDSEEEMQDMAEKTDTGKKGTHLKS